MLKRGCPGPSKPFFRQRRAGWAPKITMICSALNFEGCNNLLPWSSRPGHPENPSGGLPLFMARGRGSCPVHLPCTQSLNEIMPGRGVPRFLALLSPLAVCPSSPSESLLERPGVVAVSSCPSLVHPRLSCSHLGCYQLSIVRRPDACVCWY